MIRKRQFIIIYLLLGLSGLYLYFHKDIKVPIKKPFMDFPVFNNDWKLVSQSTFTENILKILKPADYLVRQYAEGKNELVNLYVGYHSGGEGSGAIHSPKHCLAGNGWYKIEEKKIKIMVGSEPLKVNRIIYKKGEVKEMFFYWYQVKGEPVINDYVLKLAEIKNSLIHRRRDSAFIRISVPFENDEERADSSGVKFIKDFYPLIRDFLPS